MKRLDIIARQAEKLADAIAPLVSRGQAYALVDFPNYANIGDSAIWVGATKLLKRLTGREPSYVCPKGGYSKEKLEAACPAGPIFILGGGNFGDLWPTHQELRLKLMRDFPARDIIQLPQSIHFDTHAALLETAAAIKAHGRFKMFVRDQSSADFARQHFDCPVELAPDCAFCIGPVSSAQAHSGRFIFLRRSDKEQAGTDYSALKFLNMPELDWIKEQPIPKSVGRKAKLRAILSGKLGKNALKIAQYNAHAEYRFKRGLDMLSLGEAVVTDRLHGHIMSVLLGLPVVSFDNHYKKVSGYHNLWMPDFAGARVVETADAALDALGPVQVAYIEKAV